MTAALKAGQAAITTGVNTQTQLIYVIRRRAAVVGRFTGLDRPHRPSSRSHHILIRRGNGTRETLAHVPVPYPQGLRGAGSKFHSPELVFGPDRARGTGVSRPAFGPVEIGRASCRERV